MSFVALTVLMVCAEQKVLDVWNEKQGNSWRPFCAYRCYEECSLVCLAGASHCCGKHKIRLSTAFCALFCLSTGLLRVHKDVCGHTHSGSLGPRSPGQEGQAWQWTAVALSTICCFAACPSGCSGPSQHLSGSLNISACWAPQVAGGILQQYLFFQPAAHGGIGYSANSTNLLAWRAAGVFGNG